MLSFFLAVAFVAPSVLSLATHHPGIAIESRRSKPNNSTCNSSSSVKSAKPGNNSSDNSFDTSPRCGQWDTVLLGSTYTLYLDLWGGDGQIGQQCAQVTSFSGTNVSWTTTYSWDLGSGGIKSFTNIAAEKGLNQTLSSIKSIETYWSWTQTTEDVVADVSYDLFTSSKPGGRDEVEIMIWMAKHGDAEAISSTYSADGQPAPVDTVMLNGQSWAVYAGSNGSNKVYSFLPASGTIYNFKGDLNDFLNYLTTKQDLSTDQYLVTAEAGTEVTSGKNVIFTTTSYSLVIS